MTVDAAADPIDLITAETPADYEQVRELVDEFMAWDCGRVKELGFDAALVEEFYYGRGALRLPCEYAPPQGLLLLLKSAGRAAGCGAFCILEPNVCELKRIYVRSEYRGRKLGERIVRCLTDGARRAGYQSMRLETVNFMHSAMSLYREVGFRQCAPYYKIPKVLDEITVFMELAL